jgi:hypothetical protein
LPTLESPMRRILKEHSWPPPLLPAPGDPIVPPFLSRPRPPTSDSARFGGDAARGGMRAGPRRDWEGRGRGGGIEARAARAGDAAGAGRQRSGAEGGEAKGTAS